MGNPDKRVIHVTGDGCFRMNCHELCTVQHYGLPVISVVFNNGTLGMVRQWQNLIYGKRFSQTTLDRGPDFVKLAEAYGLHGYRVTTREEMEQAFADGAKIEFLPYNQAAGAKYPMLGRTYPMDGFEVEV
jgi:acetolactate synthase-1/2/3 large subunit